MDQQQPDEKPIELPPRFLARTGRHGTYKKLPPATPTDLGRWVYVETEEDTAGDIGYTSSTFTALDREPECVGPAILEDYAQVAQLHRSQQHAIDVAVAQQLRPQLAAEDRLKDIHRRAKHGHVDLSHEIHIMRRDLERARSRDQPPPSRTLERLGRIESLLDGIAA